MGMAILLGFLLTAPQALSDRPLFAPAPTSPVAVGVGSGTVLLADVDGDGHLDMLTRHLRTKVVTVQIGDGRGGFTASDASPIRFAYPPADMALGDFDDDRVLDLAVTASERDIVDVLLGDGKGAFSRVGGSPFTVTEFVEPYNKRTLTLVDIDGDGNLDVVTANGRRRNSFAVLFGDGRGGFSPGPAVPLDADRDGCSFAFGDVDGDGHLDMVSASRASFDDRAPGRVFVRFGDGKGGFRPSSQSPFAVAAGPRVVSLADLDGDRRLDVAMLHGKGVVSVLANDGKGVFTNAPGSPFQLGTEAFALKVADVDGDGCPDLVAATVNSVSVFLRSGDTFARAAGSPFSAGPGAYNLGLGDVNGDGRPDIAASSFEGDAVTLLLGR